MAEDLSSNRGKKESAAVLGCWNPPGQKDEEDPVRSPPRSPNSSSTRQAFYAVFQSWVSRKFMTGCVVLFPVAVTFFVTWWFIQFVDGFFSPIYERLGIDIFGLGFLISLIFIFFVGVFASSWLGATVFLIGEWFIKQMPFVKHLYSASKQISSSISPGLLCWMYLFLVLGHKINSEVRFLNDALYLINTVLVTMIFCWSFSPCILELHEYSIHLHPFLNTDKKHCFLLDQNTTAFKEVAIIRHPRVGEYALGFITSSVILQRDDRDEELCSVYVPTNHLYIGDIFLVNSKEIIRPNLSVREGIEIIVSVGMSMPQLITLSSPSTTIFGGC